MQLTAPNGRSYTQPIGLFINNEFVPSKSGEKITSINPSYVIILPDKAAWSCPHAIVVTDPLAVTKLKLPRSMPPARRM